MASHDFSTHALPLAEAKCHILKSRPSPFIPILPQSLPCPVLFLLSPVSLFLYRVTLHSATPITYFKQWHPLTIFPRSGGEAIQALLGPGSSV